MIEILAESLAKLLKYVVIDFIEINNSMAFTWINVFKRVDTATKAERNKRFNVWTSLLHFGTSKIGCHIFRVLLGLTKYVLRVTPWNHVGKYSRDLLKCTSFFMKIHPFNLKWRKYLKAPKNHTLILMSSAVGNFYEYCLIDIIFTKYIDKNIWKHFSIFLLTHTLLNF